VIFDMAVPEPEASRRLLGAVARIALDVNWSRHGPWDMIFQIRDRGHDISNESIINDQESPIDLAVASQTVTAGRNNMPSFGTAITSEHTRDMSADAVQALAGRTVIRTERSHFNSLTSSGTDRAPRGTETSGLLFEHQVIRARQ
jgi:hypothetical protein